MSELELKHPGHSWSPEPANFVTVLCTNMYATIPLLDSWEELDEQTSKNIADAGHTTELKAYLEALKHI